MGSLFSLREISFSSSNHLLSASAVNGDAGQGAEKPGVTFRGRAGHQVQSGAEVVGCVTSVNWLHREEQAVTLWGSWMCFCVVSDWCSFAR